MRVEPGLPLILDFAAAALASPAQVGGKGHHLGRLSRYGFAVPNGIVLSTEAHHLACRAIENAEQLHQLARSVGTDESVLRRVRERIEETPLPIELTQALEQTMLAHSWLDTPLAVRSSAALEDSATASFAGMHLSVLKVVGISDVTQAIKAVWASVWTPQAVAYRQRMGLNDSSDWPGMAVVIMPMVKAVAAGIAFSCDPHTGRTDRLLISATPGLADNLVLGAVNGDEFVLQTDPTQRSRLSLLTSRPVPGRHACLDHAQVQTLATLVQTAASSLDYGAPWFDIEWVWDGEQFFLVQARPVTRRPLFTYAALTGQSPLWSNANARDVMPLVVPAGLWDDLSCMTNFLLGVVYRVAGMPRMDGLAYANLFNGRLYFSTALLQYEAYLGFGLAPSEMNRLTGGHQGTIKVAPRTFSQRLNEWRYKLRVLRDDAKMHQLGRRQLLARIQQCNIWRSRDLSPLSDDELDTTSEEFRQSVFKQEGVMYLQMAGSSTLSQLLKLIERFLPGQSEALVAGLLAGGEPSVTAQQSQQLHHLALLAAAHPATATWLEAWAGRSAPVMTKDWSSELPLGSPLIPAMADFLDKYGHRSVYESHLQLPRWREAPSYLFQQMALLMKLDPQTRIERQVKAQSEAQAVLAQKLPWWARLLVKWMVKRTVAEQNDREAGRSSVTTAGEIGRLLLLENGRRLVARGYLLQPSEVFHLTSGDFSDIRSKRRSVPAIQNLVSDRQVCYAQWEKLSPPDLIDSDGTVAPLSATANMGATQFHQLTPAKSWRGVAVGAGVARGTARIIRHPDDAHSFAQGDILVAPSTDPAWTPLFLNAAGLVMETGGYTSHGAIVAREFGLPAVANIPGILAQIPEGAEVEVDGREGLVNLLNAPTRP